jgi:hypothetical protein
MWPCTQPRQPEVLYPLELLRCERCTLVQLSYIVDRSLVFTPDYPYSSGNTGALHYDFVALEKLVSYADHDLIVDIGANDGTLLNKFGGRRVAVEPTGQIDKCPDDIAKYQAPFTAELARELRHEHGPARTITACNVLAHVDDIHDVLEGVRELLASDGVFVAENHDLRSVIDGNQWDTIYHEHLRFYSPWSFTKLLAEHGLGCFKQEPIPTHGGSFRAFAGKDRQPAFRAVRYDFDAFAGRVRDCRLGLRSGVADARACRERIWGVGATARATTVINYCGFDADDLDAVVEVEGSDKIGHYIPGTGIPVLAEGHLLREAPENAMLFSWHLADAIVPKLRDRGYDGIVVVPLPEPRPV